MHNKVFHTFPPVFDENSRVLILGSFPSVKSREQGFYYGHPQNRFWRVAAALLGCPVPQSVEEKRAMLLSHRIALWDAGKSCEVEGSSDSSIKNVEPNDISLILNSCNIAGIFANGKTAARLYEKLCEETCGRGITPLPSTSPANAAYSEKRLIQEWSAVTKALG